MKKYHFDDSDIKIDHKKEELRIIVSVKLADKTAISMSFLLIRFKKIKEISHHYPVENDLYPHSVSYPHFGNRFINHFDYSMRLIFTW